MTGSCSLHRLAHVDPSIDFYVLNLYLFSLRSEKISWMSRLSSPCKGHKEASRSFMNVLGHVSVHSKLYSLSRSMWSKVSQFLLMRMLNFLNEVSILMLEKPPRDESMVCKQQDKRLGLFSKIDVSTVHSSCYGALIPLSFAVEWSFSFNKMLGILYLVC